MMTGASSQRSACRSRASSRRDVFLSTSMPSEKLRFTCAQTILCSAQQDPEHMVPVAVYITYAMSNNMDVSLCESVQHAMQAL